MRQPTVSVVMPVYNCAPYVGEALTSILRQTFDDFELIVIDDGSTDDTVGRIQDAAKGDSRLVLVSRENRGVVDSLNEGIARSRGRYIARMDGDDIAVLDRFIKQVDFLDANPQVGILGGWGRLFGARNEIWHHRQNDNFIKVLLLFQTCGFQHSSVMARREVLRSFPYDSRWRHIEDAGLWCRIAAESDWEFHNLREVLVNYRVHDSQVSSIAKAQQDEKFVDLTFWYARALGAKIDDKDKKNVSQYIFKKRNIDITALQWAEEWLVNLKKDVDRRMRDEYAVFQEVLLSLCLKTDSCFSRDLYENSFLRDKNFFLFKESFLPVA